ncbi:MAG: hypothetical protein AOY29_01490 [Alcanivorax borkumensis]|jgi:ABC-type Na+ efflux pump permease subunit|uniref:DoxX protein n=1 Tax=Alcanivorax borkumensis (strain ATCC 700651 / DSM 11573 / NCIMB 13689 / SK2) TaxID=393595 RepID=Q0VMG9_ALCBS|nr:MULTISPECIES: hypothetical protein [Alcanivorax]OJH07248.1 MAG: hypothetical protein AOY29_01490 [Alcanivorax borkumensis]BAP15086.1 hypothetical protein AS19_22350 [Alcanivorax sp. NBRC 101098]CAL17629.1 hypothetical protein ABO_2181 [Alcanivorax borkumensis SK2]
MEKKLALSLLLLRLGVFIVMLMWTLDKFINPAHTGKVFAKFYGLEGLDGSTLTVLACLQLIVILAFVAGALRRYSYGAILLMHAGSTLSSWQQYLDPFNHLLFFAAWPMLAACIALYLLRDQDTLLSIDSRR